MRPVAALYIDPRGPYPSLGVETWDESRDATKYRGDHALVAHPPCGPWGRLRYLCRERTMHLAIIALRQVRANGGVLEHPAHSLLWRACNLPRPGEPADAFGGFTVEVNQCDWGHVARKPTWLYLVRVPRELLETPEPREPTHWICGGRGREGKKAKTTPVPPGIKLCSKQQRRRSPVEFARYLIRLAGSSS